VKQLDRLIGAVGSKNWYLIRSNQGEQLFNAGQYQAAADLFAEILRELDRDLYFEHVNTLLDFGRCLEAQGQLPTAAYYLREALAFLGQLEPNDNVKKQKGSIHRELGDVLRKLGEYSQAQQSYEESMAISKEIDDKLGIAFSEGQLGTLAMRQGNLGIAVQRYQFALEIFQQLQLQASEAATWHQLGRVYQEDRRWKEADRAFRESARIQEQQGNKTGAASTYGELAILNEKTNKLSEAEDWYRKALQSFQIVGCLLGQSRQLNNLAILLANQPRRLSESQQLATAALTISQTLDPAAAEIWKTYSLLARISTTQGETDAAREYRQLARTTKAAFAGTQYELQQHESFIAAVVAAVGDKAAQAELEPILTQGIEIGRGQLVAAIRRVLAGEREVEMLWDDLDLDDSMIIAAILGRVSEL
jgi:tetratricopeptide (TPR) repeat protein